MKPTPLPKEMIDLVYSQKAFEREDDGPDREFYSVDRMVQHLDGTALDIVERLVAALVVEERPVILDLMASIDSHIPAETTPGSVVGLGLNERELAANPLLTDRVVHDLNEDPVLPFETGSFDAVICTVSVDYLTRPFEVFAEVERVLRPGGLFLVVFSNRMFPEKVVRVWREATSSERKMIVEDYFGATDGFETSESLVVRGRPRPEEDRYAALGIPSDPVYAVWAEKQGARAGRRERTPPDLSPEPLFRREEIEERKRHVGTTKSCPHCASRLRKWEVPQSIFTTSDEEFLYICFDDTCPFFVGSFDVMDRQGNEGAGYRFAYYPGRDGTGSIPARSPQALRSSIVD